MTQTYEWERLTKTKLKISQIKISKSGQKHIKKTINFGFPKYGIYNNGKNIYMYDLTDKDFFLK